MKMNGFSNSKIDPSLIDEELFQNALQMAFENQTSKGIGTLREKTVHSVLKYYYLPIQKAHEIPINGYVADICYEGEIYEIQSKAFHTMKNKLSVFLQEYDVTIIYPIPIKKYIRWIHPETGELEPRRASSKKGSVYQLLPELYSIRDYFFNPKLHILCCFIEMEEYKLLDGYGKEKKLHATKTDRIPTKLLGEFYLNSKEDLLKLLPDFQTPFTSKEVQCHTGCTLQEAQMLLRLLNLYDLIERIGSKNKYYLYRVKNMIK